MKQKLGVNQVGIPSAMHFLLNDSMFNLAGAASSVRQGGVRFRRLSFPSIIRMGQEMFAREPLLQHCNPGQALRLASLISAKAPLVNAAMFVAPDFNCRPDDVTVRFINAESKVMAELYERQRAGTLDAIFADKQVWRRLAA